MGRLDADHKVFAISFWTWTRYFFQHLPHDLASFEEYGKWMAEIFQNYHLHALAVDKTIHLAGIKTLGDVGEVPRRIDARKRPG